MLALVDWPAEAAKAQEVAARAEAEAAAEAAALKEAEEEEWEELAGDAVPDLEAALVRRRAGVSCFPLRGPALRWDIPLQGFAYEAEHILVPGAYRARVF
jgi:hypothetical protein